MILAFDTYYYNNYSYTVCGVFDSWADEKAKYYVANRRKGIDAEYIPGELYKRELPCIMQCLKHVNIDNVTSIIVDGFAWLADEEGHQIPGLGKRLQDAIKRIYCRNISVIGVAKNPYGYNIPNCKEIIRGESKKPLYVTCTENEFTEHYAVQIRLMFGKHRIPEILREVDAKTRIMRDEAEVETPVVNKLIDNDSQIDFAEFDRWVAETEKNGFRYR